MPVNSASHHGFRHWGQVEVLYYPYCSSSTTIVNGVHLVAIYEPNGMLLRCDSHDDDVGNDERRAEKRRHGEVPDNVELEPYLEVLDAARYRRDSLDID